jgi:hypothetical protein
LLHGSVRYIGDSPALIAGIFSNWRQKWKSYIEKIGSFQEGIFDIVTDIDLEGDNPVLSVICAIMFSCGEGYSTYMMHIDAYYTLPTLKAS